MFREKYRSINQQISPSKELVDKIIHSIEDNKIEKSKAKKVFHNPIIYLAISIMLVLTVTPILAAKEPAIYELMYLVSPTVAQFFIPVQKISEDNGIKMEVISAYIHDNVAEIYITMQDLIGNRIDETTDLYDSYSINRPFDSLATCQRVGYSKETRTATFLISITEWGNKKIVSDKITFSVRKLINGKQEYKDIPIAVDLTNINHIQPTKKVLIYGGSGPKFEEYIPDFETQVEFLVPSTPMDFPVEGIDFTGIGYIDDMLHIQTSVKDSFTNDNHGYFFLSDKDGNKIQYDYSVSYAENPYSDTRIDYTEDVFNIPQSELGKYSLLGNFYTSTSFIEGNWQITFPLEEIKGN